MADRTARGARPGRNPLALPQKRRLCRGRVPGEQPTTVDDARVLAKEDPFQSQAWALGLVGARVAGSEKKGGDKGIDGRLYFHQGRLKLTHYLL